MVFDDKDLPGLWCDADDQSVRAQRRTLRLNRLRLCGAVLAAVGGALTWSIGKLDVWALVALVGFATALIAELILLTQQPQRDWHSGRIVAESAKTLAWRFAVCGEPFGSALPADEARRILHERMDGVARIGRDRLTISSGEMAVTSKMMRLRRASFAQRKRAYITGRTRRQQTWYSEQAAQNRRLAIRWQIGMVLGEVVALVLAAGRALDAWNIDWSGVLAAFVAASAAWSGIKQYSTLASAYATAATELAIQIDQLELSREDDWDRTVADAEEAISREHTMWLASRSNPDGAA
ncbi:DUF4231 domain-containing protein [Kribbella sp.]|uniref:DUF4231 domain-containing protein n=1 Tax=Kribbella sp. TaxID=1871183 RepID=UPI002D60C70E|nr:DUF4231 domain-containing protein [Kribbella sp.]HZX01599.1 DUF4231 domain-containing protein [Kribbella sp.]